MTRTITAALPAAAMPAVPAAHARSGKRIPTSPAWERQPQEAWCAAMPECSDRLMMAAAPSNKG